MTKKLIINGQVKQGLRIASGTNPDPKLKLNNTIFYQKPFFEKAKIPNIHKCFNGTINIDILPYQFKINKPHYEVTCEWLSDVVETFWLVDVLIDFKGRVYNGYIYYPCASMVKSHKDDIVEVLTEKIEGLYYGDSIKLQTTSDLISLH